MSKRRKELNKAEKLISNMWDEMEKFEETNINIPLAELEELRAEEQYLKEYGNVINAEIGMSEFLKNQKRIKELPQLILERQRGIHIAREEITNLRSQYLANIGKQIKEPICAEMSSQYEELQKELFDQLLNISEIAEKIKTIYNEYNEILYPVLAERKAYMGIPGTGCIEGVTRKFGLIGSIQMPEDKENPYNKKGHK